MRRVEVSSRDGWESVVEQQGLTFHHFHPASGLREVYWDERVYYEFSLDDVAQLKTATHRLDEMMRTAVEHVIANNRYEMLGIPQRWQELVSDTFRSRASELCTRFSFYFDGEGPPKLYDIDADSTYLFVETATVQLQWVNERFPNALQWNRLADRLVMQFRMIGRSLDGPLGVLYERDDDAAEDALNAALLFELIRKSGTDARLVPTSHLRRDESTREWFDKRGARLGGLYKLLTWDDIIERVDEAGALTLATELQVMEPPWKRVASAKGLLAVLWELFPDSEYLLPTFMDAGRLAESFAKPREYADSQSKISTKPIVFQERCPLPQFTSCAYPLVRTWVVGREPTALSVLESSRRIADWDCRYVPHLVNG